MVKKIGVTGGIGSGKTLICRIFMHLGIPVFKADEMSKFLLDNNRELRNELIRAFGNQIYKDSKIDRQHFASVIFSNKSKLDLANRIIHPFVGRFFREWVVEQKEVPYVIEEAAILFESGAYKMMDKVVMVSAPVDLRIQRVMERDGMDREAIEARMRFQADEEEKVKRADYVIVNDGNEMVLPQLLRIHNELIQD